MPEELEPYQEEGWQGRINAAIKYYADISTSDEERHMQIGIHALKDLLKVNKEHLDTQITHINNMLDICDRMLRKLAKEE